MGNVTDSPNGAHSTRRSVRRHVPTTSALPRRLQDRTSGRGAARSGSPPTPRDRRASLPPVRRQAGPVRPGPPLGGEEAVAPAPATDLHQPLRRGRSPALIDSGPTPPLRWG